jgi:flagellar basal-body rod protein FlgB
MRVFDPTLDILERALDARMDRHEILAGNLANADTPGFLPTDLDVPARLAAEAAAATGAGATRASAIPTAPGFLPLEGSLPASPPPLAGLAPGGSAVDPGLDGNAVDVDRTLVALAENALQYNAAARAAGKKLGILRYVVSDGAA